MVLLSLIVALAIIVYTCFKWRYGHWKRANVPSISASIPFGNFSNVFTTQISPGMYFRKFYKEFKTRGEIHGGVYVFVAPVYMPIDLVVIKDILTQSAHHFVEKDFFVNEKKQPISAHLFAIGGEKWRRLRQKLTPTFTSGKMKVMIGTLVECRLPMKAFLEHCVKDKTPVDIKEVAGKFTTDIIGSVAFGLNCNSFADSEAEFRKYGKKVFRNSIHDFITGTFKFNFKTISKKLGFVPINTEVENFFMNAIKDTVEYRKQHNIIKKDFMQLLINLMDEKDPENRITFEELAAQAFVFFIAGFETSSTTMTFCLFELAQNQDIQNKARKEINEVLKKYNGEITYEALNEMVYLKQIIDETLRKYPPLPTIDRKCTRDYKVPNTNVVIKAGTTTVISAFGLQRDPEYFPNPEVFDPERFSKENMDKITPFTYLPFGEGPRVCIETLRKYPPLPTIDRKCSKDYKVPNTDVIIKAETPTVISCFGLQRDPEYFPNPEVFNPERFAKENLDKITPFTYLPFGEGPRECIGLRFGIMQTKVGLITALKDLRYTLNKATSPNLELGFTFILSAKGDIHLDVEAVRDD